MKNIIILGSGRSGTSMLTGSLANAGYFLGDNVNYLGKNKANPKGFFEDYEINTINEDILEHTIPYKLHEQIRKRFFSSFTFYRARWLLKLPNWFKVKSTKSINNRINEVILNEPFCFKDPRFSYTLPIWEQFLNNNACFIVIFREPNKTAVSMVRECNESKPLQSLKMTEKRALKVWKAMYSNILKIYNKSNNKEQWMFLHYNQMFNPQKIEQLESFIEAKIDMSFPNKDISRTSEDNIKLNSSYKNIYNQLNKLAK